MNHETLHNLAASYQNAAELSRLIRRDVLTDSDGWRDAGLKFLRFLDDGNPRFRVWVEGNSKLPFLAFSTLPVYTCPGAGACVDWCYSLKAWRYPAAFFRQLQNAVLMADETGRHNVRVSLFAMLVRKKYRDCSRIEVRVNVDGDMRTEADFRFWDSLSRGLPRARLYCYTKSFEALRDWHKSRKPPPRQADGNRGGLLVNLSSGSRHDEDKKLKALLARFAQVRGEFIAVRVDRHFRAFEMKGKEYKDQVRKAAGQNRVFVCPGKCGECTSKGHACGSEHFKGVRIAIGIH